MTQWKNRRCREYDTFETPTSQTRSQTMGRAAAQAQQLASHGSWADGFAPATLSRSSSPSTDADERFEQYRDDEPPPIYTPSESNHSRTSSTPLITRAELIPVLTTPQPMSNAPPPTIINPQSAPSALSTQETQVAYTDPFIDDDLVAKPGRIGSPWQSFRAWRERRREKKRGRGLKFKKLCLILFVLTVAVWLLAPGLAYCIKSGWFHDDEPDPPIYPPEDLPAPVRREYRQHETSSSITGAFDLYDLLELTTHSGSISVSINIHPGPKPAVLILSTRSASIDVRIGNTFIPKSVVSPLSYVDTDETISNRTFKTTISTSTGSISGNLLHGNGGSTTVRTTSGSIDIDIDVVGVSEDDELSYITTTTGSGSHDVSISPPSGTDKLSKIQARHIVSGSGSLNIRYPMEWVGRVVATMVGAGSLHVDGLNLDYLSKTSKRVVAERGSDSDLALVEVTQKGSGSLDFVC